MSTAGMLMADKADAGHLSFQFLGGEQCAQYFPHLLHPGSSVMA